MKSAVPGSNSPARPDSDSQSELPATVPDLLQCIQAQQVLLDTQSEQIRRLNILVQLLEERLRLKTIQQYAARSEKHPHQIGLFDEAEMESAIEALDEQLPEHLRQDDEAADEAKPESGASAAPKRRQRAFPEHLERVRIELPLSDAEKQGATKTFFTKIKEELSLIPAQLKVLEYWQEKAVFEQAFGEHIVAAARPVHPLGKCVASTALLAQIITSKYADGLPLYRQEGMFTRLGHRIDRTNMANWIIALADPVQALIGRLREVQNNSDYLQADETRIQVLKEDGKTAQSAKWMWVIRGGPPGRPSVLFDYDPSRSGEVARRLLDGFAGVLQADGYSGYGQVCQANGLTRIGCWDHARRKFVEAARAGSSSGKTKRAVPSKADVALGHIRKLYAVEREIEALSAEARLKARQAICLPVLKTFKAWLENNVSRVIKGSLTRLAMEYTLNQWPHLVGYCQRGDLNISNALAENAIRPFAIGRKAWLFADTRQGARASATFYSLIETAKANGLNPHAYLRHVIEHIAVARSDEQLDALLPWNVTLKQG